MSGDMQDAVEHLVGGSSGRVRRGVLDEVMSMSECHRMCRSLVKD